MKSNIFLGAQTRYRQTHYCLLHACTVLPPPPFFFIGRACSCFPQPKHNISRSSPVALPATPFHSRATPNLLASPPAAFCSLCRKKRVNSVLRPPLLPAAAAGGRQGGGSDAAYFGNHRPAQVRTWKEGRQLSSCCMLRSTHLLNSVQEIIALILQGHGRLAGNAGLCVCAWKWIWPMQSPFDMCEPLVLQLCFRHCGFFTMCACCCFPTQLC